MEIYIYITLKNKPQTNLMSAYEFIKDYMSNKYLVGMTKEELQAKFVELTPDFPIIFEDLEGDAINPEENETREQYIEKNFRNYFGYYFGGEEFTDEETIKLAIKYVEFSREIGLVMGSEVGFEWDYYSYITNSICEGITDDMEEAEVIAIKEQFMLDYYNYEGEFEDFLADMIGQEGIKREDLASILFGSDNIKLSYESIIDALIGQECYNDVNGCEVECYRNGEHEGRGMINLMNNYVFVSNIQEGNTYKFIITGPNGETEEIEITV